MDTDQIKGIFALVVILVCVLVLVSKVIIKVVKLVKSNDGVEDECNSKNRKSNKEKHSKRVKSRDKNIQKSSRFNAIEKPKRGQTNKKSPVIYDESYEEDDDDDRETILKRNVYVKKESIVLIREDTKKKYYAVCDEEIVVGRKEDCDIRISNDDMVSKYHCRIQKKKNSRFIIEDMGSTNGTILNGEKIKGERDIESGDVIEIGDYTYKIDIMEQ